MRSQAEVSGLESEQPGAGIRGAQGIRKWCEGFQIDKYRRTKLTSDRLVGWSWITGIAGLADTSIYLVLSGLISCLCHSVCSRSDS
jgi:hypothetical protein